jgi:hypothetical protein
MLIVECYGTKSKRRRAPYSYVVLFRCDARANILFTEPMSNRNTLLCPCISLKIDLRNTEKVFSHWSLYYN